MELLQQYQQSELAQDVGEPDARVGQAVAEHQDGHMQEDEEDLAGGDPWIVKLQQVLEQSPHQ
eukprot:3345355-Amphidinium_carterae.1